MNAKQKPTQRNEKWGQKRRLTRHTGNQPGKPHGTCRIQKERNTRMPSVNQKNPKTQNTENAKRPCPVSNNGKSELSYQCLKCLKHKEECY